MPGPKPHGLGGELILSEVWVRLGRSGFDLVQRGRCGFLKRCNELFLHLLFLLEDCFGERFRVSCVLCLGLAGPVPRDGFARQKTAAVPSEGHFNEG